MGQGVLPISSPISRAVGLMTPGGHNPWGRRESDTTEHAHERLLYKGRPLSTWLRSIILCFNGPASVAWRLLMSGQSDQIILLLKILQWFLLQLEYDLNSLLCQSKLCLLL